MHLLKWLGRPERVGKQREQIIERIRGEFDSDDFSKTCDEWIIVVIPVRGPKREAFGYIVNRFLCCNYYMA